MPCKAVPTTGWPGNDFRLRIYGFTDLPPSLPLPRADLETRNNYSNYRRIGFGNRNDRYFVVQVCVSV